jgi:hypothetical protein
MKSTTVTGEEVKLALILGALALLLSLLLFESMDIVRSLIIAVAVFTCTLFIDRQGNRAFLRKADSVAQAKRTTDKSKQTRY